MSVNKDSLETAVWFLSLELTQMNDIFLGEAVSVFYRKSVWIFYWFIFEGIPI